MKYKRYYVHAAWMLLLVVLLSGLFVVRVRAANTVAEHPASAQAATPLNATIYLGSSALKPMFQSRVDQMIPTTFANTIAGMVNKLPVADRVWLNQMASALLQPSATLTQLTTQKDGLATSLQLSFYPGDPKPITASMLIQLSVLDSSTVQVSAKPIAGSPALVNGPIATLKIPFGQLNSIATTPTCGDAALAANLQVPVALGGQGQSQQQGQGQGQAVPMSSYTPAANQVGAYVEIPSSSLASLGSSFGTVQIDSNLSAKNIRVSVSGSNIVILSDIYFGGLQVGTATSLVQPLASNGNLAVHVSNTTLTVLGIFTFPMDSYNKQIEQTLNSKLNGALTGKFNVSAAVIGSNSHVPCVASDSLLLTGTTSLG